MKTEMNNEQLSHDKIQAEIAHLIAQTAKVNKETRWYEVLLIVSVTLAIVAFSKLQSPMNKIIQAMSNTMR